MLSFVFATIVDILFYSAMLCGILLVLLLPLVFFLRWWVRRKTKDSFAYLRSVDPKKPEQKPVIVGFFHPYCNAGGGGERVLWVGIRALQRKYPNLTYVVYTGDTNVHGEDIIRRAKERFNITLQKPVHFIFLKKRKWIEASTFPRFTLLGQSLGSLILGWEAVTTFVPDILLDTMGYAFTMPLFKYIGGCKVGCYVHYPTISTDMLSRVGDRTATYNNASFITNSRILSSLKWLYYRMFALIYGLAGSCCEVVMVNSTWTYGHIVSLWNVKDRATIVYPPCDTKSFLEIPLQTHDQSQHKSIVSIGQFRPEKDHPLQIKAFSKFLKKKPVDERLPYKLILIGSCRNQEDNDRVDALRELADELAIRRNVDFCVNIPFGELKQYLSEATIGLHSMWNEHFGIGVVECMAAGAITLAHDSGGPKMDIVIEWDGKPTGFRAADEDSYADAMDTIFSLTSEQTHAIQVNARAAVEHRFSDKAFEDSWLKFTQTLFSNKPSVD